MADQQEGSELGVELLDGLGTDAAGYFKKATDALADVVIDDRFLRLTQTRERDPLQGLHGCSRTCLSARTAGQHRLYRSTRQKKRQGSFLNPWLTPQPRHYATGSRNQVRDLCQPRLE